MLNCYEQNNKFKAFVTEGSIVRTPRPDFLKKVIIARKTIGRTSYIIVRKTISRTKVTAPDLLRSD